MCAANGLLEAHLGDKTPEAAKASSAERFVNLHYKLLARQEQATNGNGAPTDEQEQPPQQQQQRDDVQNREKVAQQQPRLNERKLFPPSRTQVPVLPQPQPQPQPQPAPAPALQPQPAPPALTASNVANLSKASFAHCASWPPPAHTNQPQSLPPFMSLGPGSAAAAAGVVAGVLAASDVPAPPAAWWMSNMANMASIANPNADPTVSPLRPQPAFPPQPKLTPQIQSAQQGTNPDLNFELLGMNLGDLWADYSWEDL